MKSIIRQLSLIKPLFLASATSVLLIGCSESTNMPKTDNSPNSGISLSSPTFLSELGKKDTQIGTGATARPGQVVTVHYTGWLYDTREPNQRSIKFDSSKDRNKPFKFPLGAGRVIKGWDQGVAGMKVGGKRTLLIPADLGYGMRGAGRIPPNAALIFDVELLAVN